MVGQPLNARATQTPPYQYDPFQPTRSSPGPSPRARPPARLTLRAAVCSRDVDGVNYYMSSGFQCQACSGRRGFLKLDSTDSAKLLTLFLIMLVALGVAIYKRKAIVEWIDKHVEKFNNSM